MTAEFATILPVVALLAALLLSLARTVTVAMDCQDAAAVAARELVLVDGGEAGRQSARLDVQSLVRSVAGENATVDIGHEAGLVTVVTHCPVLPGPLGVLPAHVRGEARGVEQ